jgi:antitoxin YefM
MLSSKGRFAQRLKRQREHGAGFWQAVVAQMCRRVLLSTSMLPCYQPTNECTKACIHDSMQDTGLDYCMASLIVLNIVHIEKKRGSSMDVMTYSDARAQLKRVMDRAIHDKQEVVVTRKKGEAVVVVSLETWNAVNETLHLLSTPKNASRLRSSIAQLDAGDGKERELSE